MHTAVGDADAPVQDVAHVEFPTGFTDVQQSPFVGERGRSRHDMKTRYSRQGVDQLFGKSVAENLAFLVGIAAQVLKGRTAIAAASTVTGRVKGGAFPNHHVAAASRTAAAPANTTMRLRLNRETAGTVTDFAFSAM